MKPIAIMYLLAGERDFRLLRGVGADLEEIVHRTADDFVDVDVGFASERGRNQSGGVSFGNSDSSGREAEDRRRLARHAVAALDAEWAKGGTDRIVLAAGPKMLGELRGLMPKALAGHIAADVPKDLIKVPAHDLYSHFEDVPRV